MIRFHPSLFLFTFPFWRCDTISLPQPTICLFEVVLPIKARVLDVWLERLINLAEPPLMIARARHGCQCLFSSRELACKLTYDSGVLMWIWLMVRRMKGLPVA